MINRNFTLLWVSQTISQLGDKFYAIALAWWILEKTHSPSTMGLFLLTATLPGVLAGILAGALVDRWRRKSVLIATDALRGLVVLMVYALSAAGSLEVAHVFAAGLGISLITAFFDPALQTIIPEVVEEHDRVKANSMVQMIGGLCKIAGPLLGALAIALLGWDWVFLGNSLSYFAAALLSCLLSVAVVHATAQTQASLWASIGEGFAFIRAQPRIVQVLKVIAVAHVFVGGLAVLLPFLANGLDGVGVSNLGYLEMCIGIGLVSGSAFIGSRKGLFADERKLSLSVLFIGAAFAAVGIAQHLSLRGLSVYLVALVLVGSGVAFAAVFWQSLLQRYTPDPLRGRVFSLASLIGNTSLPLAYGAFGFLLERSSIAVLMMLSGLCLIGLAAYDLIADRRRLRVMGRAPV